MRSKNDNFLAVKVNTFVIQIPIVVRDESFVVVVWVL
jgi:hypothetical protein